MLTPLDHMRLSHFSGVHVALSLAECSIECLSTFSCLFYPFPFNRCIFCSRIYSF